jgi:ribosomal protein S18 acetylase RimI-like enzyme
MKTQQDYRFTPANDADIKAIRSWFTTQRKRVSWGGPTMKNATSADDFAKELNLHGFKSFSLYEDDELVGFAQIQKHASKHCHIGRLAIHPKKRGLGLSHTLQSHIFKTIQKEFRSNTISLFVYFSNSYAHHSYMKNGFVSTAVPKGMVLPAGCDYMLKRL